MFIPLMKADAVQRLVYGSIDETPDRAGEVMDYATAKPAFEAWSKAASDASGGKSLGNVRAQHDLKKAAGKLVDISFDDDAKRISFCAKIVDDQEWEKVDEGVYTGFSPGGRYAKRWADGLHKRYTPTVGELSVVDVPCIPSATFTMVKADGVEEEREFVLDKAYEPGNEATLARAEALAKAAGKDGRRNDFLVKARAELIAENADEALAKMAGDEPETDHVNEPAANDPVAKLEAALAKADAVAQPVVEAPALEVPEQFRDLAQAAAALKLLKSDAPLAKGLYTIGWIARLMEDFASLQGALALEAGLENDGSAAPAKSVAIVKAIGELLVSVAQEEVAEAISSLSGGDVEVTPLPDCPVVMELAASILDLVKADTDLMEKAGARNSKGDQAKIQSMHDNAVSLGATCDAEAKKALTALEADRDRLAKTIDESAPKIEAMVERMEKMSSDHADTRDKLEKALAEIATLKEQPEPAKGVLITMEKAASAEAKEPSLSEKIAALPNGPVKQAAILASVGKHR